MLGCHRLLEAAQGRFGETKGSGGGQSWGQLPVGLPVVTTNRGQFPKAHAFEYSHPHAVAFLPEEIFFMLSLPLSSENEDITEDFRGREPGPAPIQGPLTPASCVPHREVRGAASAPGRQEPPDQQTGWGMDAKAVT